MSFVMCGRKSAGGQFIYLAALTGVDESLYEAAYLDGATKFQRLIYITLPFHQISNRDNVDFTDFQNDDYRPGCAAAVRQ